MEQTPNYCCPSPLSGTVDRHTSHGSKKKNRTIWLQTAIVFSHERSWRGSTTKTHFTQQDVWKGPKVWSKMFQSFTICFSFESPIIAEDVQSQHWLYRWNRTELELNLSTLSLTTTIWIISQLFVIYQAKMSTWCSLHVFNISISWIMLCNGHFCSRSSDIFQSAVMLFIT